MRNVKLAFRTLFKTPFVTAVAILSLALGIGANAAIFSLFDQMLLRPLPVPEAERLVNLSAPGVKYGSTSCGQAGDCEVVMSYPMFRDLERAPNSPFSGLAAHVLFGANVSFRNATMNTEGVQVSGSYFPTLGLRPALGRLLGPDDDRIVGGHYLAVLGHSYWETRLGADPNVVGQTIVVNGQSMTIVGVAPRGFEGTTLGSRPSVYVPLTMRTAMQPSFDGWENRRSYWAYVFGRLRPGVTLEQASTAANAIYKPIITDVEAPLQQGMSEATLARFRARELLLEDGRKGQSSVHGEARTPLLMLFAVTGIVLLIACANIANLLLARGATRSLEMAVRLSLGASRRQVLAQLLTESVVLSLLGGVASLIVAKWTLNGIAALLPPEAAASLTLTLQPSVVLFAAGLAIGTGLLFGMFPALHSTRPDLVKTIRSNAGNLSGARSAARFRSSLVTAQIALAMALLVSAGLFLKSLVNVSRVDLGLQAENIVTFRISPQLNGYQPERSRVLFARVEEELAALPGVTHVSAGLVPLLSGSNWGNDVNVQGWERGPDIDSNARFNEIGAGYFRTLGISVLRGREFTAADAVGKFMSMGSDTLDMQIVGLVQDAKYSEVKDEVPPLFFTPYRQDERLGRITFYVRTSVDPMPFLRTIPGVIAKLDPNLPVEELKTLPMQIRENVFMDRMISTLSTAFAVLATLLAAVGLYGVLAYTVAQRTREIGVRMALGADAGRVRLLVMRQVGMMVAIGGAIGIAAAIGLGRAAQSLLFGLQGHDPAVVATATVLLALVALGAGYVPARRASRVDPMQALRYE